MKMRSQQESEKPAGGTSCRLVSHPVDCSNIYQLQKSNMLRAAASTVRTALGHRAASVPARLLSTGETVRGRARACAPLAPLRRFLTRYTPCAVWLLPAALHYMHLFKSHS